MSLKSKIFREIHYIIISILHILAMNIPNSQLKRSFYRSRGTKVGKHVNISYGVFIEEHYPEHVTINDNVEIAPFVKIAAHDSSYKCISAKERVKIKEVLIEQNVYIGVGAIILPGVKIGHHSIIGAGSIVTKNIPPNSVVYGQSASVQQTTQEWLQKRENQVNNSPRGGKK